MCQENRLLGPAVSGAPQTRLQGSRRDQGYLASGTWAVAPVGMEERVTKRIPAAAGASIQRNDLLARYTDFCELRLDRCG